MGDFIENGTLAGPMADAKPLPAGANADLIPNLTAARWNAHRSALLELRGALFNGALSGITAENMYPDTATGLAAVAEGAYFTIPSFTETESLILYRKSGGVAVEMSRYPSALIVAAAQSARDAAAASSSAAEAARVAAVAASDAHFPPAVTVGARNVIGTLGVNVVGPTADGVVVLGGSPSFPHNIGNASLAVIGGGYDNTIGNNAIMSCIAGAAHCVVDSPSGHGFIGGGSTHANHGAYGVIGGGLTNTIHGDSSFVGGGRNNVTGVEGSPATYAVQVVGGGNANEADGDYGAILGGFSNRAGGPHSVCAGGYNNNVSTAGTRSALVGGDANGITNSYAFLGGGQTNAVSGTGGTVPGGKGNTASGSYSGVAGGLNNTASGSSAAVVGGESGQATANHSSVLGGLANEATAVYSSARGRDGKATFANQHATGAGKIATVGDAQAWTAALKRQTTDAAPSSMNTDGSNLMVLPDNTTWVFSILVAARRVGAAEYAAYKLEGVITRGVGAATTAILGTVTPTVLHETVAGWDVTATADTTSGDLRLRVTGEVGKTINWAATVTAAAVSG
jgi:hypothetical protein